MSKIDGMIVLLCPDEVEYTAGEEEAGSKDDVEKTGCLVLADISSLGLTSETTPMACLW